VIRVWGFVCWVLVVAPFQCASDPNPARRMEDSAPEALWSLAERFRSCGDEDARRVTLQQIIEQYPSSREATRARQALDNARPRAR